MVLLGPLSLASIRPKSVQCAGVAIDDSDNGCMMAKSWDSLGMGRGGGGDILAQGPAVFDLWGWGTLYFKGGRYISLPDPQYFARGTTYFGISRKYYVGRGTLYIRGDHYFIVTVMCAESLCVHVYVCITFLTVPTGKS